MASQEAGRSHWLCDVVKVLIPLVFRHHEPVEPRNFERGRGTNLIAFENAEPVAEPFETSRELAFGEPLSEHRLDLLVRDVSIDEYSAGHGFIGPDKKDSGLG